MLGEYPIDLSKHIEKPINDKGIPLFRIPRFKKTVYYPVDVCNYALANYNKYIATGDEEAKDVFLIQADWLKDHVTDDGRWEHYFILPGYDFKVPWIHGMAQGMGMSVLFRAYEMTKKEDYKGSGMLAFLPFTRLIGERGIRYEDDNGDVWYEEYSVSPPPHILNGFIFALIGVYDYYKISGFKTIKEYFDKGIDTLVFNLYKYDLGYWSRYNLVHNHPATMEYHQIHIDQLSLLFDITRNQVFEEYYYKWMQYKNSSMAKAKSKIGRGKVHLQTHGLKKGINIALKERGSR